MSKSSAITAVTNVFRQNGQGSITGSNSGSALTSMLNILYADLAAAGIAANEYSASSTYAIGNYCIYDGALYKCSVAITTAEAWNASHWTATNVATELNSKVDKVAGKGLSTEDFSTAEKNKLLGIEAGAEVNIIETVKVNGSALTPSQRAVDVTKSGLGLGNVDNTSDLNKPISTAVQTALDTKATASALSAHTSATNNPHNVNKSQVGLGNCDNTSDANKPVSTAQATAIAGKISKIASPVAGDLVKQNASGELEKAGISSSSVSSHLASTSNPHSVTKAQVGLGNCDNTADLSKPISTATQTALDLKANSADVTSALAGKADIDGNYPLLQAGSATNIAGADKVDAEIVFRTAGGSADIGSGTAKIDKILGNSYAWNQLVDANTENVSTISGHKYYCIISNVGSIATGDGNAIAVTGGTDMVFDLTLIFGAGNEPATVEALKATEIGKFICSGYHAFDAGSLLSSKETGIKTVGFNQWDEQWELGNYNISTGAKVPSSLQIRSKNPFNILPNTNYYCKVPTANGVAFFILWYDANNNYLSYGYVVNNVVTSPSNAHHANFYLSQAYGTTYKNDITINISHSGIRNGEYEPYWASTTNLPVTTATGKLNGAGSSVVVFADGMKSAGSVRDEAWNEVVNGVLTGKARKKCGIVDLGTINSWSSDPINESGNIRYIATISGKKEGFNVLSNLFTTKNSIISDGESTGMQISGKDSNSQIYISMVASKLSGDLTTSAGRATAFNNWLASNTTNLIYELATPQEYTMDSPWAQGYRVDDFGTEEIVPSQGSTPTSAPLYLNVEYALNAKDAIRNLPKNYVSAQGDDNTLARIESALASAYGITMTHTWDNVTNNRYNIALSGGWQPVASAPASATATGTKGQYFIDSAYLYVCTGTNEWKRVAIATW